MCSTGQINPVRATQMNIGVCFAFAINLKMIKPVAGASIAL